jgi:hypothetical protein
LEFEATLPRNLEEVLDYFLPSADAAARAVEVGGAQTTRPRASESSPAPRRRPAALPIIALPIGDRDVLRAAFAWNLTVEIARLGGNATLLAPADSDSSPLWPSPGRGPIGAELAFARTANLPELNRAALDLAVSHAADAADGGVVLVRVPPSWIHRMTDSRALLRWILLFTSPESRDLREAYALTKRLVRPGSTTRIGVTIHGARQIGEAEDAFSRLAGTALRHLRQSVVSYGLLVDDLHVFRAIVAQRPIGLEHPQSRAAVALRDVARLLLDDARNHSVA